MYRILETLIGRIQTASVTCARGVGRPGRGALALSLVAVMSACGGNGEVTEGPLVEGGALGVDGAHEHGVVRMGLAVDGMQVSLDIQAPLQALLGFERSPESEEERTTALAALEQLRTQAGSAVVFAEALSCQRESVTITGEPDWTSDADHDHAHEDDHDHADDHEHDHADEDDHDHDDEDHEHSDIAVEVLFTCQASPQGTPAELNLSELFSFAENIDLTVITALGQSAGRVGPEASFRF